MDLQALLYQIGLTDGDKKGGIVQRNGKTETQLAIDVIIFLYQYIFQILILEHQNDRNISQLNSLIFWIYFIDFNLSKPKYRYCSKLSWRALIITSK